MLKEFASLLRRIKILERRIANQGSGPGGGGGAHASSHEDGGGDEIDVTGLSGLLADGQTPLAHATSHESGGSDPIQLDDLAAPDDNTDLNASTSAHGLLLKATAPASGLLNVVGIGNGETVYSNKPLFDTTNPAALGTAAPGTQVIAARRDHVHTLPKLDDLAAPDDNTDLDASATTHGLMPKWTSALISALLDLISPTRGAILYRGESAWAFLLPDTAGYVLTTNGPGEDPTWEGPEQDEGAPITRTEAGLLAFDDFGRANSSSPGGDWTTDEGTAAISSSRLACSGANRPGAYNSAVAARTENFTQALTRSERNGSSTYFGTNLAHYAVGRTGYALRRGANDDVFIDEYASGSLTGTPATETAAGVFTENVNYTGQFYTAPGVQEGYHATGGSPVLIDSADTTHDAVAKVPFLHRASTSNDPAQGIFDNFLWMRSKYITVDGLPSGYKAKVVNSGASVVAEATESSGTALVDCSRFGGATEFVPFAGWPTLRITNGSDTMIAEYSLTAVYPGDEYTFTNPNVDSSVTLLTSGSGATYTVPAGKFRLKVTAIGAGGGGGGADSTGTSSGGAAGGVVVKYYDVIPGQTFDYTVSNTGGAGGTAGANAGTAGADTVFDEGGGGEITAGGGGGGGSQTGGSTFASTAQGTSGTATGGDMNFRGATSLRGWRFSATLLMASTGASGPHGGGGDSGGAAGAAGAAAVGFGAGGGGATAFGGTDRAGGDGAPGLIIVEEFNS